MADDDYIHRDARRRHAWIAQQGGPPEPDPKGTFPRPIHQLKTWPIPFSAVKDGSKTYEVRKNDRDFQVGDLVQLWYFDPDAHWQDGSPNGRYSGDYVMAVITYLTPGGAFGLPEGMCVFAFKVRHEGHNRV